MLRGEEEEEEQDGEHSQLAELKTFLRCSQYRLNLEFQVIHGHRSVLSRLMSKAILFDEFGEILRVMIT